MKQDEINFVNMADTVINSINAQKELWESKKPIHNSVAIITGNRTELSALSLEQANLSTKGTTASFKHQFENMADLALGIIQKLRPFAMATGDKKLLSKIDHSRSDILKSKQLDGINICKIVYQTGVDYLANTADYELTQEQLDTLHSSINGVSALSGNRDAIIGTRKTATDHIPVLIGRIREQLNILDDLIPALITNDKFVQTYKNNRRIIDR